MSLKQMESAVQQAKLPVGQKTWWPGWLERYARWTRQIDADRIEIREQGSANREAEAIHSRIAFQNQR